MSRLLTVCNLPGGGGFMDWGRLPREEIIKRTREVAAHEAAKWNAILAARDEDFICRVVRGSARQALVETLSPSYDRSPSCGRSGGNCQCTSVEECINHGKANS